MLLETSSGGEKGFYILVTTQKDSIFNCSQSLNRQTSSKNNIIGPLSQANIVLRMTVFKSRFSVSSIVITLTSPAQLFLKCPEERPFWFSTVLFMVKRSASPLDVTFCLAVLVLYTLGIGLFLCRILRVCHWIKEKKKIFNRSCVCVENKIGVCLLCSFFFSPPLRFFTWLLFLLFEVACESLISGLWNP